MVEEEKEGAGKDKEEGIVVVEDEKEKEVEKGEEARERGGKRMFLSPDLDSFSNSLLYVRQCHL